MRTRRVAVLLALGALAGAGCGGGGETEPKEAAAVSTPAPAPSGFVTERGTAWSFARPGDWTKADVEPDPGKEFVSYDSAPGTADLPSQVGLGAAPDYAEELSTAVRVGRDLNTTKFRNYQVNDEGPVKLDGAEGYKLDATYDSFQEEPVTIRIVDVYAQTPGKRQMNLFVRGPEADFERLGLDRIVESFRAG